MVGKYPFQVGKTIYIVANGHYIKEGTILRIASGFYTLKLEDGTSTRLKAHRLFGSKEDDKATVKDLF